MLTRVTGVGDPVAKLVHAGHQGRAGRSTGGADVEVVKAHTLIIQAVGVRGPEQRVAMTRQISISLVIGEDKDDVRLGRACTPFGRPLFGCGSLRKGRMNGEE